MILINPYYNRTQKLGIFARYVPLSVPIGIGALAGYLLHKGKNIKILDEHITPITYEVLEEYVKDFVPPYMFGIYCLTAGISRAYELSKMIKAKYPDAKIILGGIHPTVLPEEALGNSYVDIVVRREGEEIANLLYNAIKDGHDYSHISGISLKNNSHITHNPLAELPDIKLLPQFPYHLFANHPGKYNLGFIVSSRGCPYDCIFCSQRAISGRLYRCVPLERIIEELDLLINKYGQEYITFMDDNFIINKERTKKLCELMYNNNFHKKAAFDCQTRGDSIDADILPHLKMAGFRTLDIGFETASERLMVLINKSETVKQNIQAAKLAKRFGFQVSGTFILGLPTETREERWQAYKLAKELQLDYVRFNNATPYPGTKLHQMAKEENRLYIEKNYANLNACGTLVEGPFVSSKLPYVPKTSTKRELRNDILKANLFFSLRPKRVFHLLIQRAGPAGWFLLPKKWYFSPKEWYYLIQFGLLVLLSLVKIYLPRVPSAKKRIGD